MENLVVCQVFFFFPPDCYMIWYRWGWDHRSQGWCGGWPRSTRDVRKDELRQWWWTISDRFHEQVELFVPDSQHAFYKPSPHLLLRKHYSVTSRGFWVDWSIIWQQRTRCKGLLLNVLVIYSTPCEPEARAVMNMTSAPSERRAHSLAVKQALKSETVVGSREV